MPRCGRNNGPVGHATAQAKYDAHNAVLAETYGALAGLRRELADSKLAIAERTQLLEQFADCADAQRAWLLLDDYLAKLALAPKDIIPKNWWQRLQACHGQPRLEELARLFLCTNRPLPTELLPWANHDRISELERAEQEQQFLNQFEQWMFPPGPAHLDGPRATLRLKCDPQNSDQRQALFGLEIKFSLSRIRSGEKIKKPAEIVDLTTRSGHERELFSQEDWDFIQWLAGQYPNLGPDQPSLLLTGLELLQWLVRWGHTKRLALSPAFEPVHFHGQIAEFKPHIQAEPGDTTFTHLVVFSNGQTQPLRQVRFFDGQPALVLADHTFFVLRNAPPPDLLNDWLQIAALPVKKMSRRFLAQLRKSHSGNGAEWQELCLVHPAKPEFIFELVDETVRVRLLAKSDLDQTAWQWNGHDWERANHNLPQPDKPEFIDDPRIEPATNWLRQLDLFTPEPGLWIGDAQESFLLSLARSWPNRPPEAEYLGNPAFQRLFLSPRKLRPRLMLTGSGIDWFSVSIEWEQEGYKLSPADLERLATATSRYVKLPDSGWVELDTDTVHQAHEAIADIGLESLSAIPQQVDLMQAAHLDEAGLSQFTSQSHLKTLRDRVACLGGIPQIQLPASVQAILRPYQKDGFDFLCYLAGLGLGGVLADDMGLGKTIQTLAWLAWLMEQPGCQNKPALVICPASVLHNWRREASRFTPSMKVLVLESGPARHNLHKKIPQFDLIVTNYALLRRDLSALKKFSFCAAILDEAQFIKNPDAQVTRSVKQLNACQRLALTGTPLENRLLDLWSILDYVQPGYLGTQTEFIQKYEPPDGDQAARRVARRRLSARLRPMLLRRLKRQVAKDLPERIEERRDCDLGEAQRILYLAELCRSREQVLQTVQEKGLAKSRIHVLSALTRLRQICCHPRLVGNDADSGKTQTLFELLEPLLAEGQKVLVFSQFVQMLRLLEAECLQRKIQTHLLIGATKHRQEVVQTFQTDGQASVFLLSLRAAGTGLNLTSASYVVLYDPWWNPAVEAQAIDRSHRIGQTNTVIAYRLIAPQTVEEKIWELQQQKAQTIADVLGEQGFARSLSQSDLEYLFAED